MAKNSASPPQCFIIMPLTTPELMIERYSGDRDHFRHVLQHLFTPAVENAGLTPIAPIAKGADVIHAEIITQLETVELVLVLDSVGCSY